MNHRLLRLASKLTSLPLVTDLAYGPVGRALDGLLRRIRFRLAATFPVALERFGRAYFTSNWGLGLWITNVCNARCNFCAYPQIAADKSRLTGSMSLETFKKAVDEFVGSGGKHVDMTPTVGDPLLDSTLLDKIRYCRETARLGSVSLTTNAILLHRDDMFKKLIDAGITFIAISLPDLNPDTYRKVYGVDRCREVTRGIASLLRYNRERGEPTRIVLRFRNNRKPSVIMRSKEFRETVRPYLSHMVTCNFTVDFDNWGGSIKPEMLDGVMKLRTPPKRYNIPCVGLTAFIVQHDGAVRLCGCRLKETEKDELIVGNLKDNSLHEIGRSEAVHNIFKGFYQGERPPVCDQCSLYTPMSRKFVSRFWPDRHTNPASVPPPPQTGSQVESKTPSAQEVRA